MEHLGDLYMQLDEPDKAFVTWDRALDAGPEDPKRLQDKIANERDRLKNRAGEQPFDGPIGELLLPPQR